MDICKIKFVSFVLFCIIWSLIIVFCGLYLEFWVRIFGIISSVFVQVCNKIIISDKLDVVFLIVCGIWIVIRIVGNSDVEFEIKYFINRFDFLYFSKID